MKKFWQSLTKDTGCCLFYSLFYGLPMLLGLIVGYCDRKEKHQTTHAFVSTTTTRSTSRPWSGNHLDKDFIDEVEQWDTVFICLSSGSKRFHSTLACPGMQNCNSGEDAVTREEAEDMGRSYCHRCYY